jgi:hypothetical protein
MPAAACVTQATCNATGFYVCNDGTDCPAGTQCENAQFLPPGYELCL